MNDSIFPQRPDDAHEPALQFDVLRLLAQRFKFRIALWLAFCLLTVALYLAVKPTMYSATAMLDLEPQRGIDDAQTPSSAAPPRIERAQIESQALNILSQRNLRFVFNELKLDRDNEYGGALSSILPRSSDFSERALKKFTKTVAVERAGESAVVNINVRASTPERAAAIANAIVAAFIHDKIGLKIASARASGEWSQARIDDLNRQDDLSARAVADNRLLDTNFPAADARVVNLASAIDATPATQPLLLGLAAVLFGLGTTATFLLLHANLDQTIWHKSQVKQALGRRCLAALPSLDDPRALILNAPRDSSGADDVNGFVEGLQAIRAHVTRLKTSERPLVVGVTSVARQVGKSTVAACLARVMARSENGVLLVDADFQSPSLSRWLAPLASKRLAHHLNSEGGAAGAAGRAFSLVAFIQEDTRLSFLPATAPELTQTPDGLMSQTSIHRAFDQLKCYSYIVLDLPPVFHAGDLEPFRPLVDTYLLVAESGNADVGSLREAAEIFQDAGARVEGLVLNNYAPEKSRSRAELEARRLWTLFVFQVETRSRIVYRKVRLIQKALTRSRA